MVVAENEGTYGNTEKTVAVRKPLMILATLPRVLGPGETVALPVDVFAMEKQVKDVKIEVEVNDLFSVEGNRQQSIHFKETGDEVINFKLQTAQKTGIGKLKITAISGKEKASQEIEIDLRSPNPKVVDGFDLVLEPGKKWNAAIQFKGIEGTNKATIELSTIPALGLEKRLDYLIQYPHGCIEQTTSSVFPQLFVGNLIDLSDKQKEQIQRNIKNALKRLQLFQTANGGFSYWPGEGDDSEWGTNYAGHFMIEAEKQGYSLPIQMKAKWLKYQQDKSRNWSNSTLLYGGSHSAETNENIQAYRLFVLALGNNPELGAMNRLREEKKLSASAKWRLAAAYKMIGQKEVALKFIEGLSSKITPYQELSYSYGSETRDKAMILETLALMQEKTKGWPLAKEIAYSLNSDTWMNTQETAYCLLAMCEYTGAKNNSDMKFTYSLNGSSPNELSSKKTIYQVKYNDKDFSKSAHVDIKNTGQTTLFAKLIVEGTPLIGDKTATAKDLKMEVSYKDMKGKTIQPDKIIQGTDFIAKVTITNPGTKGYLQEMVLNQIFPSGWEIHNTRMDGTETSNPARYQDIRDDRIYTYYNASQKASLTFEIQLNATYLGKFYLPTVYSEAMYDNTINARVPGRWVEVVKDELTAKK
jgi:alpha-2-macroglobulin